MSLPAGEYRFGPQSSTLAINTGRTGAVARAGHDLLIHVTAWEATLNVADDPAQSRIEVSADGGSLRVLEGTGGMKALDDDDKQNIQQTIDDEVLHRTRVTFRSNRVSPTASGLHVEGELSMFDRAHALAFDVAADGGGSIEAVAVIAQTDFGMKPYTALFGALKVADEVRVTLTAQLPSA
jgi:polyisoprenoid-binding protein YceI